MDLNRIEERAGAGVPRKGSDYILPVRFDGTAVPGLLPTVGYLDYHKEGPERICHLFLQKLGAKPGTAPAIPVQAIRCDLSDRAQILSQALNQESYPVVSASAWDQEIELSVLPNVSSDAAFFDALRNHSELVIVAYGFNVALARCVGSKQVSEHGKRFWTLRFRPERTEFASNFEMGSGETPVERYAEMRLRRLLLDEYPMPNFSAENLVTTANQAMHESLLQGTNSLVKIEHCIFPNLYAALSSTPERFIEIAWIQAISMAKLSAAVEQVQQLHLILTGDILGISFVGIRHRKYTNVLPHRIEITGSLSLAKPVRV